MRRGTADELVPLDDAGEAAALGHAGDVDELDAFEQLDGDLVTRLVGRRLVEPELAHDYLWRVHQQVPGNGELVVFNRSHYEDVLVVRVHDYVPAERWKKRYHQICNFEQMLADEGTTIVKLYLHISMSSKAS